MEKKVDGFDKELKKLRVHIDNNTQALNERMDKLLRDSCKSSGVKLKITMSSANSRIIKQISFKHVHESNLIYKYISRSSTNKENIMGEIISPCLKPIDN